MSKRGLSRYSRKQARFSSPKKPPPERVALPPQADASPIAQNTSSPFTRTVAFTRAVARLNWLASSPALAYPAIFVLQLKVVWGLWLYKDLESGDTASYFLCARLWHALGITTFTWSPLYTIFYGSMLNLSSDAYAATMAHRLVMVLSLSVLVLALMRRLLAPQIAWLVAAWWVVLPINFDALYAVHLFAVIPILLAYLVLCWWPDSWGRGACLGILLVTAALMRNELAIPCAVFAAACLVYEIRARRRATVAAPIWRLLSHYSVPCILAAALSVFCYLRTVDRANVMSGLRSKHTLNICQVYAFGYLQRHPEWTKNPWTECQELMQKTFGKPEPSLSEAFVRNPRAMLEHFAWNFSLAPNGLQVLLFNAMSGKVNPDYVTVHIARIPALIASLLLALIWIFGMARIRNRWAYWRARWIRPRIWIWVAMFSVASMSVFIIATQRPRPSYLFSLSVLLMALTGLCVQAILGPVLLSRWKPLTAFIMAALLIVTPRYYFDARRQSPRTFLSYYRALQPFAGHLGPGAVIMTPGYGGEICYAFAQPLTGPCKALTYYYLRPQTAETPLNDVLAANQAKLLYADENMLRDPVVTSFVRSAQANGWETIGFSLAPDDRWMLFEKSGL